MAEVIWNIKRAVGGLSDGSHMGYADSYRYGEFIDSMTDPDAMDVLPAATLDSTATVTGFVKWIDTNQWGTFLYDDLGNLYKRNVPGDYTNLRTVAGSTGNGLTSFKKSLYYASANYLGSYGNLDAAMAFNDTLQPLYNNDYHPMRAFTNLLIVGNGRYVATMDDSGVWNATRLTLRPDENVRCIEVWDSYVAIGTQVGTAEAGIPRGNVYLWDGTSDTYNSVIPFSGSINSMVNDNGLLMLWIGRQSDLYDYNRGTPRRIKQLPRTGLNAIDVLPGATGTWNNQVRFGTSLGGSALSPKGIYTFGSKNNAYPKVLTFDYALSSGTKAGIFVSIGAFRQISATEAIFSWKNGTTVGIDRLTTEAYATESTYQSLVWDNQRPFFRRKPTLARIVLDRPLRTGEYVKFYMRKDGETTFVRLGTTSSTADIGKTSFTYNLTIDLDTIQPYTTKGSQHELQLIWGGTGTTRPSISSCSVMMEEDTDFEVNSN